MDEQPEPVLWMVLAVSIVGLLVFSALRWVPPGHLLVVTRRGIVSRVVGRGLALRTPWSRASALVSTEPEEIPLAVRATTRDGTDVRLLVRAEVRLVPPAPLERYVDPVRSAVPAAEGVLAELVEGADLADLPDLLAATWGSVVESVDRETRMRGLRVVDLELAELDALLVPATLTRSRGSR